MAMEFYMYLWKVKSNEVVFDDMYVGAGKHLRNVCLNLTLKIEIFWGFILKYLRWLTSKNLKTVDLILTSNCEAFEDCHQTKIPQTIHEKCHKNNLNIA